MSAPEDPVKITGTPDPNKPAFLRTVKDLRDVLAQLPDDMPVWLSSDAAGDEFRALSDCELAGLNESDANNNVAEYGLMYTQKQWEALPDDEKTGDDRIPEREDYEVLVIFPV
jgi:hypothetical protein